MAQGEVQAVDAVASAGDGAHDGVVVDAAGIVGAAAPHHAVAERLYAALDAVRTVAAPYGIEGHILVDVQHRAVGVFRGSAGTGGPSGEEESFVGEGAVVEHAVFRVADSLRCHRAAAAVGEEGEGMGGFDMQLQCHRTVASGVGGEGADKLTGGRRCGGQQVEAVGGVWVVGAGGVLHHSVAHGVGRSGGGEGDGACHHDDGVVQQLFAAHEEVDVVVAGLGSEADGQAVEVCHGGGIVDSVAACLSECLCGDGGAVGGADAEVVG